MHTVDQLKFQVLLVDKLLILKFILSLMARRHDITIICAITELCNTCSIVINTVFMLHLLFPLYSHISTTYTAFMHIFIAVIYWHMFFEYVLFLCISDILFCY